MSCKLTKKNEKNNAVDINEYICDTEADIALLPKFGISGQFVDPTDSIANEPCSVGSVAFVCETSNVYMLSPSNQWVQI